jgi:hypothetical protein
LGQQPGGGVQLATLGQGVDLVGEGGHVADGDCPLVGIASCGLTGEAELQSPNIGYLVAANATGSNMKPVSQPGGQGLQDLYWLRSAEQMWPPGASAGHDCADSG